MPYFIVIPAFLAASLLVGVLCLFAQRRGSWRPVGPFLLAFLLWSTLGFIALNLLLTLGAVVLLAIGTRVPEGSGVRDAMQLLGGLGLLLGPYFASAAGYLGGGAFGVLRQLRKRPAPPVSP